MKAECRSAWISDTYENLPLTFVKVTALYTDL